jgi:WD40 repeat protein
MNANRPKTIIIIFVIYRQCKFVLHGHSSTIRCLKVLDGRPIAVSGSRDSSLRVWDIERGMQKHVLVGHTSSVRAIEVHGNRAVSGSYDTTCRLWDVDSVSHTSFFFSALKERVRKLTKCI